MPDGGNMWESTCWYDDQLVRTPEGWRIKTRICRVLWWGGNARVRETIPGMSLEQAEMHQVELNTLRRDANAGKLGYLTAIGG